MFVYDRAVRFEDVDAAGIVFYARFLGYCHDAMERLFDGIEGGYVDLITRRQTGLPAVHANADFQSPLRYGDVARIAVSVTAIGQTSCGLRYVITRARDAKPVAVVDEVHVLVDIPTVKKLAIPADLRALLEKHRAP